MLRVPVLALGVLLTLGGCRLFDKEKDSSGEPRSPLFGASRNRDKNRPRDDNAPSWLDGPGDRPATPASGRPNRGGGTLSGTVLDPDGQKASGATVEVQPNGGGRPLRATTDDRGGFLVTGLEPGRTYVLTATLRREGKVIGGQTYAQPTTLPVQMLLFENWGEATNPASPVFPDRPQGAPMTPQGGFDLRPDPKPLSVDENGQPPSPASDLPPPAFSTPSQPRRPELTTTIPTPTIIPPPPLEGNRRESRSVRFEFGLLDTLGRPRVFPTGRSQDLILLDFMTTTCVPCKKTIPLLKDLQARYGSQNLEVIGVCCDDVEMPQRRAVAAQYERTQDLNYLLYIEPGKKPGNVMDRFQVEAFPTLVLLNGDGNLLWQGDSRKIRQLEAVIRQQLEDNPSPDADRPPPPPAVR